MPRLVLIFAAALAIGLCGMSRADAAHHKKTKAAAHPAEVQPVSRPMARPPWAAPQECLTDDGYGRFLPCSVGDGR
jgi:hypothetical protein